jgi:deoxyribodipyrimidine photolyase-related protein
LLIFPNQLFLEHPGFKRSPSRVVLIEDSLFFGDTNYPMKFHKQKLWLHRATMKRYQKKLQLDGHETLYLDYDPAPDSLLNHLTEIAGSMTSCPRKLIIADPTDFMLEKRLKRFGARLGLQCEFLSNPQFINAPHENVEYRAGKTRWFMGDFYKYQRRRLDILMDGDEPAGGKWSFDEANRKKVPKKLLSEIPPLPELKYDAIDQEAVSYVENRFPENPGSLHQLFYPTSHEDAENWLKHFLNRRLANFGDYEDAIVQGEPWLWHSVLTPSLNTGLLTPDHVVKETLTFANEKDVKLNSLEGFLRQIIGWREFIRATYQDVGVEMRTSNHWQHHHRIPSCFYDGTTGILPIDDTIKRILKTGYCHHIERCEFEPDDVYRWFMEMFIDSYDWVMVPNAYSMSQHADGGLITTKPYFSGSSYVRKMSHYKVEPWCEVWDGLYWSWIWNHRDSLANNPRWAMMCSVAKKMTPETRRIHLRNAAKFFTQLDGPPH